VASWQVRDAGVSISPSARVKTKLCQKEKQSRSIAASLVKCLIEYFSAPFSNNERMLSPHGSLIAFSFRKQWQWG
jgi:hypothetical protein